MSEKMQDDIELIEIAENLKTALELTRLRNTVLWREIVEVFKKIWLQNPETQSEKIVFDNAKETGVKGEEIELPYPSDAQFENDEFAISIMVKSALDPMAWMTAALSLAWLAMLVNEHADMVICFNLLNWMIL